MSNNRATSFFDLRLSVHRAGVGSSSAVLVHEALADYSRDLIKTIAQLHAAGDYEEAASFLEDYEAIAEIQYRLVHGLSCLAFFNEKLAEPGAGYDTSEKAHAVALEKYLKEFKPKDCNEG